MERIQSEQQYLDTINSDGFTVIKFDTTWCPDCKNLDRFIGDVIDQHADKTFYALDAEKFQPFAEEKWCARHSKPARLPERQENRTSA